MNKLSVFEIKKSDKYEGIVGFKNSRGNIIKANFWGLQFEVGKEYLIEFNALEYSLLWETVFSYNKSQKSKIEQTENETSYNCYGIIKSINPTIADFGDFKLSIGELSNDQNIINKYIYWKIFRLDVLRIIRCYD